VFLQFRHVPTCRSLLESIHSTLHREPPEQCLDHVHRSQSNTDWVDAMVIPCTSTRRSRKLYGFPMKAACGLSSRLLRRYAVLHDVVRGVGRIDRD
jgi:hypothetical protein